MKRQLKDIGNLGKEIGKGVIFLGVLPARKMAQAITFLSTYSRLSRIAPPIKTRDLTIFLGALWPAALTVYLLLLNDINRETAFMGGIFVLACLLWATEAMPLFATALLIIGLEILLLANPAGWENFGFADNTDISYTTFLLPLSDPMLVLFFGGFILARAAVKNGVDSMLAGVLLKPFTRNSSMLLLGIMAVTAIFSMWMSNTATTAMMLSLTIHLLKQYPENEPFKKGIILSVPLAANIGGLGTPVASPPNAVAIGYLDKLGYNLSFTQWTVAAFPVLLIMLAIAWRILWHLYKPLSEPETIKLQKKEKLPGTNFVMVIFSLTVLFWLTEAIHGIPSPVISLIPVVAFTTTGIVSRNDINNLEWNILLLIAGGIALGMGMTLTGLDTLIVESLSTNAFLLMPLLIFSTVLLSNFMSNTAAANLLIPIGISMMMNENFSIIGIIAGTMTMALSASLAMALPVSTPPNALAYASGKISGKDFIKPGIIIGLIGLVLLIILFTMAGILEKMGWFID
ncbi:DASS family sodium-coupled anion symporter [soil metagenome]